MIGNRPDLIIMDDIVQIDLRYATLTEQEKIDLAKKVDGQIKKQYLEGLKAKLCLPVPEVLDYLKDDCSPSDRKKAQWKTDKGKFGFKPKKQR